MPEGTRPQIFIASSSQALDFAMGFKSNLEGDKQLNPQVEVWKHAEWVPGAAWIDSLVHFAKSYEYGIFVFHPDDYIYQPSGIDEDDAGPTGITRGNVLFELGLFMGHMGKKATFPVIPSDQSQHQLISDLNGVKLLKYDCSNRANCDSATATAAHKISKIIQAQRKGGTQIRHPLIGEVTKILDGLLTEKLDKALTTRFIGKHQVFFRHHVIDALRDARSDVLIATDFPAYGAFSAFEAFMDYRALLKKKVLDPNCRVRMKVLSADKRVEHMTLKPDLAEKNWKTFENKPNAAAISQMLMSELDLGEEPKSAAGLRESLISLQSVAENQFKKLFKEDFVTVDGFMPINMWIFDGKRAVFSMPDLKENITEHGFDSSDQNLIPALRAIWDTYSGSTATAAPTG